MALPPPSVRTLTFDRGCTSALHTVTHTHTHTHVRTHAHIMHTRMHVCPCQVKSSDSTPAGDSQTGQAAATDPKVRTYEGAGDLLASDGGSASGTGGSPAGNKKLPTAHKDRLMATLAHLESGTGS